jgi:hypothetical protein
MEKLARSVFSDESDSLEAGRAAGEALLGQFGAVTPKVALVYATMNHDQRAVVDGLRGVLGPNVSMLGCSVQGVVSNEVVTEDGFALGVMGLGGGGLGCAVAAERDIQIDSRQKGRLLGQALKRDLGCDPRVVVLYFDPLCGADIGELLEGISVEVGCPLVGGAAGQPWGPPRGTFQYWNQEVFSHGVVGVALAGPFGFDIGLSHGTVSIGIASTITKAAGTQILEMDGRPAGDVWRETTRCRPEEMLHQRYFATWALGVELACPGGATEQVIRGAFGFDPQTKAITLQAAVPEGTRVTLQHRSVERILEGTEAMARDLAARLVGRQPWAVLGFECAARTYPFLGEANTREEHQRLRGVVAPSTPWLGMMAWGEIGPCAGRPTFHNYTYPVLVLTD